MKKFALIMAGGSGTRAGGSIPKQLQTLQGLPVIAWSMQAFRNADPNTEIIVVMNPALFDDWQILVKETPALRAIPHTLCCGGRSRAESVKNGLITVRDFLRDNGIDAVRALVAVHDAARPLVSRHVIDSGWRIASANPFCAVPCCPATDSLRHLDNCTSLPCNSSHSVDRSHYVTVQTPQTFRADILFKAYHNYGFEQIKSEPDNPMNRCTDDASFAELAGNIIALFAGDSFNIKVTNPEDFAIAGALLNYLNDPAHRTQIS